MDKAIRPNNHPFRFLLWLEWGLLAITVLSAFGEPSTRVWRRAMREAWRQPVDSQLWLQSPLMAAVWLLFFGLMGLYLPLRSPERIWHTVGQLVLMALLSITVLTAGRAFPFAYLVLVIRGCLMYRGRGRWAVAGMTYALFIAGAIGRLRSFSGVGRRLPPQQRDRFLGWLLNQQLNFAVLFGLVLCLVVLLIQALMQERSSQQKLKAANEALRQSALQREALAAEQERSRIARDIHDSLGHALTALNIQLESGLKLWRKDEVRSQQFLSRAKQLGSEALSAVRRSVGAMQQQTLTAQTLPAALQELLADMSSDEAGAVRVAEQIDLAQTFPDSVAQGLYRIAQAAVTNAVRHAQAQQIMLTLVSGSGLVRLQIVDDGIGFDRQQVMSGYGLQSMQDRATSLGGSLTIDSDTRGTQVLVEISLKERQPGARR